MTDTSTPRMGQRIALGIEYTGSNYRGWQRQAHADSIQKQVEDALAKILIEKVTITCAGRTDAGVHATAQVVHFDTQVERPLKAYTRGMNTILPPDIAVTWAKPVSFDFHARYTAFARRYRYIIYNNPLRSGVFGNGVTHVFEPLNEALMHESAQCLVGENDYTSFRASHCQSKTPYRHIEAISVYRMQRYVIVDVKANAFLHHMVRNIVGSLIKVGTGEQNVDWLAHLLALKDRTQAAATAKPHGLYLVKVDYPEEFAIPKTDLGPLFIPN
ncbi:MAG: tRNA pseudouridine(38-40) synthase TruA [Glaciecola sp.]